jgi:inhibitor of KinA sporulation pathway (predicted exonuclease)
MKNIVIFDTEYTSWEGCLKNGWDENKNQYMEIIQISALKIDLESMKLIDEIDLVVKTSLNPTLSQYIQNLTGISQKKMEIAGIDLEEALTLFKLWLNNDIAFSYGSDIDVILKNCKLVELDYIFNINNFNDIREIFKKHNIPVDKYTSGELHRYFNLDLNGHVHNSLFDCHSLYESLKKMSEQKNISSKNIIVGR